VFLLGVGIALIASYITYSVASSYKWLVANMPTQLWNEVVWSHWNISKASFVLWLALQDPVKIQIQVKILELDSICRVCFLRLEGNYLPLIL